MKPIFGKQLEKEAWGLPCLDQKLIDKNQKGQLCIKRKVRFSIAMGNIERPLVLTWMMDTELNRPLYYSYEQLCNDSLHTLLVLVCPLSIFGICSIGTLEMVNNEIGVLVLVHKGLLYRGVA